MNDKPCGKEYNRRQSTNANPTPWLAGIPKNFKFEYNTILSAQMPRLTMKSGSPSVLNRYVCLGDSAKLEQTTKNEIWETKNNKVLYIIIDTNKCWHFCHCSK
jgi:hypothetical protein